METINPGDKIETKVGGPYEVISVVDNLVKFKLKHGIGLTLSEHVTKLIKK